MRRYPWVLLHPAVRSMGAGLWHLIAGHETDRRVIVTKCGIRAAIMERTRPGDQWRHSCLRCTG